MSPQVLYDFDGTLTRKDTAVIFIFEALKIRPRKIFRVLWYICKVFITFEKNKKQDIKNKIIGYLIEGLSLSQLSPAIKKFSIKVNKLFRSEITNTIYDLHNKNYVILIVTASPTFLISHCMKTYPTTIIGTEFEVSNGFFTGELRGKNCFEYEKVKRVKTWAYENKKTLNVLLAWGDSLSDIPMLKLAKIRNIVGDEKLLKKFLKEDPSNNYFLVN